MLHLDAALVPMPASRLESVAGIGASSSLGGPPGEGVLTKPTAGAQPRRRELLFVPQTCPPVDGGLNPRESGADQKVGIKLAGLADPANSSVLSESGA